MALTGSGQISFNDVRIEMSQSAKTNYAFGGWAWGYNEDWVGGNYAPINVLSTGSEFCRNYSLYLGFGGLPEYDYYYIDCGGVSVTQSINEGETDYFTAKSGSVNHPSPATTLTDLGATLRFSESNLLDLSNLSMSAWYSYDHTLSIGTDVTGTLYQHADISDQCYPSTMLIVDVGTTNATYNINISGSQLNSEEIYVYYGKPWNTTGANGTGSATYITRSVGSGYMTFNYNYTYNASSGSNLYFVMLGLCP
jgi:hypothetical protein